MGWHPVHTIQTGWHPPPLHPVLILRTERVVVRFSNIEKTKPDDLIWEPIQKLKKIPRNAKILPLYRSLPSINTAHSSECYPFRSITLQTLKNGIEEGILKRKCSVANVAVEKRR